jgi:mannose-1-phosphate guanylyltransferase
MSLYKNFMPEIHEKLLKIQEASDMPDFTKTLEEIYPTMKKISFDDAILVKLTPDNFRVIAADLGWSDVGTWDALKEALANSKDENITVGDVILEDTKDTLLFNYDKKLCIGIDLNEIIIINTEDVLLICPKNSVPKIKKFVEKLNGTEYEDLV